MYPRIQQFNFNRRLPPLFLLAPDQSEALLPDGPAGRFPRQDRTSSRVKNALPLRELHFPRACTNQAINNYGGEDG